MLHQPLRRTRTDAGDVHQIAGAVAHLAALAVKGHRETMGFVAHDLHQMQHRRMMVEHDRIIFLSENVDDFFAFGDRSKRLVDDLEGFEGLSGGVELSDAPVDQRQAGHGLFFFLQAFIAARDHFAHGREIVHAFDRLDNELAVIGLLHLAVFPHHHRGDGLGALNVRNVKALDPLGQFGQGKSVLERFLDQARIRLHHAEALVIRLLGIVAGEIDQLALVATLRDGDVDSRGPPAFAC